MKRFMVLLLVIVFAFTLAACGATGAADTNKVEPDKTGDSSAEAPTGIDEAGELSEDALDAAMSLLVDSEHKNWPADRVHPDMPEYKKGKMNGWNQWSDNKYDVFMLIADTSEADLEEYKAKLVSAGFQLVNGSDYRKDAFEVKFQFNTDTTLQISSYKEEAISWPKALAGIPPLKKGILSSVIEPPEGAPDTVQLYFVNLTQPDIDEWVKELEAKGFTGDSTGLSSSSATLNGKAYGSLYVQIQENGTDEWMIDFLYSE